MSLFLLSEFFLCAFYFLSLPPSSPRWLYPHPSLSPVAFARAALRLSCAPLPSRLNEQRRAGSSTSLLIKWPRESAPGFFNDEILLAAASRRQFSSSRRRGAARDAATRRRKTTRHGTWHRMIVRRTVSPLLTPKNSVRRAKFYYKKNCFITPKNHSLPHIVSPG